jgi:RNA polymerase sigma-70 factor, ECF subfamily
MSSPGEVTRLLCASSQGDRDAEAALIPLVYSELRRRAASYTRRQTPGHTLQPTALVHEAYLKLIGEEGNWQNRSQFFGVAAGQMRRILVGAGGDVRASFQDALAIAMERPGELVAIDDALERLGVEYPRQAQVVELRFHAGYTEDEIARILRTSLETVKRDWKFARVWLSREVRVRK